MGMASYLKNGSIHAAVQGVNDGMNEFPTAEPDVLFAAADNAKKMLQHYIPNLPIGEGQRYVPATYGELGVATPPEGNTLEDAIVEWRVEQELDGIQYVGYVDAILKDTYSSEFVIVDWKTKARFTSTDVAAMDSQLDLYALMLRRMGYAISKTVMWQFRSSPPVPARINKDMTPSVASQNTTWDIWCATLPVGIDPTRYEAQVRDKLKTWDYFILPVETMLFDSVVEEMSKTLAQAETEIRRIYAGENAGVYNTYVCRDCRFNRVCAGLRNGVPLENLREVFFAEEEE